MFVPIIRETCLDVVRFSMDRCVCGASSLVTYSQGRDSGYCVDCAKKRKKFIDNITGNIELNEKDNNIFINTLEQMRKNILQERFCYMIDKYFVSKENLPFVEPYEDLDFIEQVYREKRMLMSDFILPAFTKYIASNGSENNKTSKIEKQYNYYYEKLCLMYNEDGEKLEEALYKLTGAHTLEYCLKHK